MGSSPIEPGEVVYLLAEVRAGGRIHEIGTSARVLAAEGGELALEVGGAEPETVSCRSDHVSPARPGRLRAATPRFTPAPLRPTVA